MEIGVCGFGYSGSGAVIDMLKDYPEIYVADNLELSFIYKPDGLEDLLTAICTTPSRYFSSDSAIRRFIKYMKREKAGNIKATNGRFEKLLQDFLNEIIQCTWKGSTSVHAYQDDGLLYFLRQYLARRIRFKYEHYFGRLSFSCWPDKKMYFSYMKENEFVKAAKTFVQGFIDSMVDINHNNKVVIDQPFAANNPEKSFCFFNDPKAILVNKDPRDLYLLAKTTLGFGGRFIPSDSVDTFITYYIGLMKSCQISKNNNVLCINFEDLIYNYNETKSLIERFLDLNPLEKKEKLHFDPRISINNTQLWIKHPQYNDDIKKIEDRLSDYLFNFEDYSLKPNHNTKSF